MIHQHLPKFSLTFLLGFFFTSQAQIISLDTIIALPFPSYSENTSTLFIYKDEVYFSVHSELEQRIEVFNLYSGLAYAVDINHANLEYFRHIFMFNEALVYGSSTSAFAQRTNQTNGTSLEIELKIDALASANRIVALETYPDYFNPKPEVGYAIYQEDFTLVADGVLPFDFPQYLAKVGSFFAVYDSLLVYCMATDYKCQILNLNSLNLSEIINRDLNDKTAKAKIEAIKAEVMKPELQARAWLGKLQELDKEITRIERVLFDGKQILIVKRMPDSEWDYRLVDIYHFNGKEANLICTDIRVESVPTGKISYSNPPSFIMDSNPVLFYNSKLFIVSQFDYSAGFKEGIEADEFNKNLNAYYENNVPKYAVYVYSIRECDAN